MFAKLLCKLLQRKTYDVLAKKHTLLLLFVGLIIVFVSTLRFGESLMEWSKEKYSVVFSPYSNNILGKSYRNMLCQYVPIDVVYTWVNGSDPLFLKELTKAKEEYGFLNSHLNCSFSNCVKSHMVLVRPQLPNSMTLSDLEETDSMFQHISNTFVVASQQKSYENVTVLVFPSRNIAEQVIAKKMISVENQNYTLSMAYITDNWGSQNTVLLNSVFFLTQLPYGYSDSNILEKLPSNVRSAISEVFIYEEKSLAVLTLYDPDILDSILKLNNITFENKVASVSSAYLVIELPADHEDISASRFTDNEELRYSLRSLEKHAPWVQHIYIITNGQIPYWLNLDNPLVSIVTHEEIFPNKSHLPTFSSPAIECHLHRIPNLSQKFIYLNDDVMFGRDVWPEDFYTHTKGQKVYLSWPVPNCAEGCPSSWIRDGYCDKPCNNSQCQWDGGDCTADNPMLPFQAVGMQQEGGVTTYFHIRAFKNYCNNECADTWLADRYCDKACNIRECGFDAGDCGLENFHKISQLLLLPEQTFYYLPDGENVGYFNLTEFFNSNYTLTDGLYEESPVIRTIAISLKYSVIGIVLYPNHNATNLTVTLKGEFEQKPYEKQILLHAFTKPLPTQTPVAENTTILTQTEEAFTFESYVGNERFPKIHSLDSNKIYFKFQNVNASASQLPKNLTAEINNLKQLEEADLLTHKGYLRRKAEMIAKYINSVNESVDLLAMLVTEKEDYFHTAKEKLDHELKTSTVSELLPSKKEKFFETIRGMMTLKNQSSFPSKSDAKHLWENLGKIFVSDILKPQEKSSEDHVKVPSKEPNTKSSASLKDYFLRLSGAKKDPISPKRTYLTFNPTQRHLLDTFGDSLRHVNKLYNEAFGYEARKVPSHIAHFVDRNVMSRLTDRFEDAFIETSSHKIRSSNDMQFAFSYYYFLMSEMDAVEVEEIFNDFDTDSSGTWSDREIRTILTRLYDLPLDFTTVAGFEQMIINCSLSTTAPLAEFSVPHGERYYGSKLPTISLSLVKNCPPVCSLLLQHFGNQKKNGFEIVGEEEVAFKMIHNNVSQVLIQIDDLRKHPKKFVCLNDNMNHGTQEAEVIRAVIQDFYESLFPTRSQFELSPEYRNRFLYVSELRDWRWTRDIIRIITYLTLGILILFSIFSFWKSEMRAGERYPRLRTLQNRRNPQHV
ncbi:hypothetical protein NPIL_95291 [Nephila pilipes]|uniref:N-acetylglucosamine-1-phosphotransferase subunits alpha/beta n=1 Tax=Nephila pilipes TaxID=299642 RepID=A0A8X6P6G9_NEPPI|nr:hypothetical protein NPIL_95291 [Nephila pilipes]